MKAARSIHEHDVRFARLCGGDGIEDDGGGIAPVLVLDDPHFCALRPDFKLIDRRRTEGIRRRDGHAFALTYEPICNFADGRRLADAVDADKHDDAGIFEFGHRRLVQGVLEDVFQKIGHELLILDFLTDRLLADLIDDVLGGAHGNIGGDEDLLQFVIECLADLVL